MRSFYILVSVLVLAACSSDDPDTDTSTSSSSGSSTSSSASASGGSGGSGGDTTSASGGAGGTTSSTGDGGAGGTTSSTGDGGAGGTTSSTGVGGAGGAGGAGGSGGSPVPCGYPSDICGDGMYCDAPGCDKGICKPIPTIEQPAKDVVCGCDGANYWNASIAASHGVPVRTSGVCAGDDAIRCGGFTPTPATCPKGAECVGIVTTSDMCMLSDSPGSCWAMPADCSGSTARAKTCDSKTCESECELIKANESRILSDGSCPALSDM